MKRGVRTDSLLCTTFRCLRPHPLISSSFLFPFFHVLDSHTNTRLGAPYDPHAYAKGWITGDEGHNQALSGNDVDRARIYDAIETVLMEENYIERGKQWEDIHNMVHNSATMLPLWGKRIP